MTDSQAPLLSVETLSKKRKNNVDKPQEAEVLGLQTYEPLADKGVWSISTVTKPSESPASGHLTMQRYEVRLQRAGEEDIIMPHQFGVPAYQDVADVICYAGEGANLRIFVNKSVRPLIATRNNLLNTNEKHGMHGSSIVTGQLVEVPGVILRPPSGDVSLVDAAARIAAEKIPFVNIVKVDQDMQANPIVPSVGDTVEVVSPVFVKLSDEIPTNAHLVAYGNEFAAERQMYFLSPQQIVDGFLKGEIEDMRLLLWTLQLAEKKGIKLNVDKVAFIDEDRTTNYPEIENKIVSRNNIREAMNLYVTNSLATAGVESVEVSQIDASHRTGFLLKNDVTVNISRQGGEQPEIFTAEMIVREGVDSMDCANYFWHEGKLYLTCKARIRAGMLARTQTPHPIHTEGTLRTIEGVSGAMLATLTSRTAAEIIVSTKQMLAKKGNIQSEAITYVGSYYPSAGNNPQRVSLCVAEIDPTTLDDSDKEFELLDVPTFFIEVDELLALYDEGTIQDPRLVLQAQFLKQAFAYTNNECLPSSATPAEKAELINIIQQGSLQVDRFMQALGENAYTMHVEGKLRSAWYRKVTTYIEEKLGGFLAQPDEDLISETDKHFFAAMVPMFAVPGILDIEEKYQNYYIHDGGHYIQGDILPYNPQTNTWMSKDDYVRYMSRTEANAVFDSDYRFPLDIGLATFEKIIGGTSVATAFRNLGITDMKAIKDAIISIERDGIIPDEILVHPAFEANKANIVGRLLRFHVMDHIQAAAQYDQWKQNVEVVKVAARFCNTVTTGEQFEQKMAAYETEVLSYHEGVNTIKAHISRLQIRKVTLPAMKVGVMLQILSNKGIGVENDVVQKLFALLDLLEQQKNQLQKANDMIEGMIVSDRNVEAIRIAKEAEGIILGITAGLDELIADTQLLNEEERTKLTSNTVPYFQGFAEIDKEELANRVAELEEKNLRRIGK